MRYIVVMAFLLTGCGGPGNATYPQVDSSAAAQLPAPAAVPPAPTPTPTPASTSTLSSTTSTTPATAPSTSGSSFSSLASIAQSILSGWFGGSFSINFSDPNLTNGTSQVQIAFSNGAVCQATFSINGTLTAGSAGLTNAAYTGGGNGDPGCSLLDDNFTYSINGTAVKLCLGSLCYTL